MPEHSTIARPLGACLSTLALAFALAVPVVRQPLRAQEASAGPLVPGANVYLVTASHLDTQWNWTLQDSIREFVPQTFFGNFARLDAFPRYVFAWEGAAHYAWFKEYYPAAWPTLLTHVREGRWRVQGGWVNAVDVHVPSPESLFRQALYGKAFFRRELGAAGEDIFLPDSFGFGFALPSVARHSGLRLFSTQKLTWGSAVPVPFPVGRWEGPDGSQIVAALAAGDYVRRVTSDPLADPYWREGQTEVAPGTTVGLRYFGVGDMGGAPDAESVLWVDKAVAGSASGAGGLRIRSTSADQLVRDLTSEQVARLPRYRGELVMKTHGVGCYTSQAAMKAWNRRNELLADAAERAAVAADWLGGPAYPRGTLNEAWWRVLLHQFHDDLTGTSIPQAYVFSWNDEVISLNQFASVLATSAGAVASGLDTRVAGVPIVVYNPLSWPREDVVEADVTWAAGAAPTRVRVVDTATGREVASQVVAAPGPSVAVAFLASMPPVGFSVFDVQAAAPVAVGDGVRVDRDGLESRRYRVRLDQMGNVASVFDKRVGRELLAAPLALELRSNPSPAWPAWEILWETLAGPARAAVAGPAEVRVVEAGPVRGILEVRRRAEGSAFVERIGLTLDGDLVEIATDLDWRTPATLLKAVFPLTAVNTRARFDLGLGTIERENASQALYEVPAQQWAAIDDRGGAFGVAIASDSKYGWDKPDDHTLRLSLVHTPEAPRGFAYQATNDLGRHRFTYAIGGYRGDWRAGRVPRLAARLNQPMRPFRAEPHAGALGRSLSMVSVSSPQVAVQALKRAEQGREVVVRLQEQHGTPAADVRVRLAGRIVSAREINAAEEPVGPLAVQPDGTVRLDLGAYAPRTLALTMASPAARLPAGRVASVALPFDRDGFSTHEDPRDGDFYRRLTLPAEQWPAEITWRGIPFRTGATSPGARNVADCKGQVIRLPAGFPRLYILATAVGAPSADATFTFVADDRTLGVSNLTVQEWQGAIGQWDSRLADDRLLREVFVTWLPYNGSWAPEVVQSQAVLDLTGRGGGFERIRPGFIKRAEIAWVATHRHGRETMQPYLLGYVFGHALDVPPGATAVRLPNDPALRVFAATVADAPHDGVRPARPLYE